MFSIHDELSIKNLFHENNISAFRYGQLENAIYKNFISHLDDIQTLPKDVRSLLKTHCFLSRLFIEEEKTSSNGQTTKILFKTEDGYFIESVLMRHLTGRNTLCISCQAGCPMACTFCATGKLGLQRNLEFDEIVEQVLYAMRILQGENDILRNIVYMGMGEPFLNYENLRISLKILCEQKKLNFGNRRVTVSTCGIIPGIKKFMHDFPQTSLAISLHAPNDSIRKTIMPVNHTYPIHDLMSVLDEYVQVTNKRIFYEYIMIHGVNDSIFLADELGKLLQGRLAHVNFIPYNPGEGTGGKFAATPKFVIEKFQKVLEKYDVPSTIRVTMGDDIDAACGQLANSKGNKSEIEI